jgi:hypothetical protein
MFTKIVGPEQIAEVVAGGLARTAAATKKSHTSKHVRAAKSMVHVLFIYSMLDLILI